MKIYVQTKKFTKYGKNLTENRHLLPQKTSTPSSEWTSHNNDNMMAHVFDEFSRNFKVCPQKSDFTTFSQNNWVIRDTP